MALYPYPPSPAVSNQLLPIVYGTFTFDIYNPTTGTNLIKGFPITGAIRHQPMKFAGHGLKSLSKLYYTGDGLPLECPAITTNLSAAQSYLTLEYVWVWIMPNESNITGYGLGQSTQLNGANGYDGDVNTNAGIRDYFDNTDERRFGAGYRFPEDQEGTFSRALTSNAERGYNTAIELIYKVGQVVPHDTRVINLYHVVGTPLMDVNPATYDATVRTATGNPTPATVRLGGDKLLLHIYGMVYNPSYPGNGTVEDQVMASIYRFAVRAAWNFSRVMLVGENPPEDEAWASGTGRAYSSWIDNAGRSNSKNATDLIDNISGVIESILRDELGVTTALIDEASFDTAIAALGDDFNMQILERKPAFDYIKQLCEQSYFMFTWGSGGKARLVMLNNATPTTQRTIPYSHIKDGQVKITRESPFCNTLNIKSRWHEYYQAFNDESTANNATSRTAYGIITYNAEWPNILESFVASTTVTDLAAHLVSNSNGIWANPHNVIAFETLGYTNADLECGDWIELEAASVDGQVKLFGATWSGKKFIVTKVQQTIDSTKITAMQLY